MRGIGIRNSLVWVPFLLGIAWGQAPSYSAAGIVNASSFTPGPFAPNSVLSLFGSNLARGTQGLTADDVSAGRLPLTLASASVYVQSSPAPLLFVSPGQINFLVPSDQIAGDVTVRVVREGVYGQPVTITLADAAPAVFSNGTGYLLAEDWNLNNAIVTTDAPARPGDTIVIFATGMGRTQPNPTPGEIPRTAAGIAGSLKVLLNGTAVDPSLVKYAGLTPGCAGLYQVNLLLPADAAADPEIRLVMGAQSSGTGMKLAVRRPPDLTGL